MTISATCTWRVAGSSKVLEITSPILSEVPQELSNSEYLTERIFTRITTAIVRDRRYIQMRYDDAMKKGRLRKSK